MIDSIVWLLLLITFLIVEAATVSLVSTWFAGGALAALLVSILNGLGVEIFGNAGDAFDPNLHNAVMHTEDENFGENTICQVFQKGFKIGDKIVRFAMVQVAN